VTDSPEAARYADPVLAGSRAGIARAITLVESSRPDHRVLAQHVLTRLLPDREITRQPGDLPGLAQQQLFGAVLGMLTELASNGSTTFAAVNDWALAASPTGFTGSVASQVKAFYSAGGEMVAVNQDTGTVIWDTPLPSMLFGAATVTNDVVFTTTFKGYLYALDATTGAILFSTPMSSLTNAPVAVDGDYVIAGAGLAAPSSKQRNMIIAYKLGATGKLPDTVGS